MALQQNLEELSVEELASMVQGSSFDIIPSTEVAPGMAEAGTIPEASAEMLPPPAEPGIESSEDISDRRRQATRSRLRNMRAAQDTQMEIS